MKKMATGALMAAAILSYAAPAYASANDWIRYQEANDPAYNRQPYYYYDSYRYDDGRDYDYSYNYRYSYDYRDNRQDPPRMHYCQDGGWVPENRSCPDMHEYQPPHSSYRSPGGMIFNFFQYFF